MATRKINRKAPAGPVRASEAADVPFPGIPPETEGLSRLRAEAEKQAASAAADTVAQCRPGHGAEPTVETLLRELQVNHLELEMQNQSLRQARTALEESRDRYIDFYDFSPVGYLTLTDKGLIDEINLTGAAMLGAERSSLLQRPLSTHVAAEHVERWLAHFSSVQRTNAALTCSLALVRPDGSRIDVQLDSLRLDKPGKALRVVLTDISQLMRTEEALNEALAFTERLIDTMCDGFSVVDANGIHLSVNPALCRMTGFSREELLGTGLPHLYWPPEQHERNQAVFRKVLAGMSGDLELIFMRKSGERFPVIVSPSMVRNAEGEVVNYTATIKDITELKRAEAQQREMAANLEATVAERTKTLRRVSAQLIVTEERERRRLAQELHDNLGQLLAVIKIKLTSMAAGPPQSSIDQIVELVGRAEKSARTITHELSPPLLHTLGLVPALEWLADELANVYGIAVHIDSDCSEKTVVDEIQTVLYRSVRELLINVAKHAGVAAASLSCLCNESRLTIVVSDAGSGFDPAHHFGAWPGHHSFGLRSIYERITNIGGEMDIDSSPGNGTTITLSLPHSNAYKEIGDDPHNAGR